MTEPGQTKPSDAVKELLAAIQSQHKVLLLTALSTLVFAFAPRSNPLLRKGQAELEQLHARGYEATARNLVAESGSGKKAVDAVFAALKDRLLVAGEAPDPPADAHAALGIKPPRSLGDLVSLVDGETTYCAPRVEARVVEGLGMLKGTGGSASMVQSLQLRALHEAEAGPIARLVIDASIKLADHARPMLRTGTVGMPQVAASPLRRPPESIVVLDQGRPREVPNPEFLRWQAADSAYQKAQTEQAKAKAAENATVAARTEASRLLRDQMLALERATGAQLDRAGAVRFVVVTVELKGVVDFEGQRLESLTVPMACEQRPLFENGDAKKKLMIEDRGTILSSLRVTPIWPTLRGLQSESAASVVEAELAKDKDTLEVAGLRIDERLAIFAAPLVMAGLALWQLMYALLLRRALRSEGAKEAWRAAAVVPPHIPSIAALVVTVGVAIKLIASERAQHPWVWASAGACVVLVSACFLVLLMLPSSSSAPKRPTPAPANDGPA